MSEHAETWPFDQSRNCAVFTIRQILDRSQRVLHVTHDPENHGWQFLGWETPKTEDARIVALEEMIAIEPAILELADLAPGWHAWRRSVSDPWTRARSENDSI